MPDTSIPIENGHAFIKNVQALISIFGRWPSFHDAEVCRLRLDRDGTCLEMEVYIFAVGRAIDERGHYKRSNESLLTLRFCEIEDVHLEGFNHQNVIASLTLRKDQRIDVELESIFGLGGKFSCGAVEVVKVVPYVQTPSRTPEH